jgi:cell wall-associated NlpC family hydrolase
LVEKLLLGLLGLIVLAVVALAVIVVAIIGTHPWLAVGMLGGSIEVHDARPSAVVAGVPSTQWPLIDQAARGSTCNVAAEDLAAIAKIESDFGRNLYNPRSGTFGYGQFDQPTWTAFGGGGDPNNPADALPAMARTLCARGYGVDRTRALNSYGGCITPMCLGTSDYATAINKLAGTLTRPTEVVEVAQQWLGVPYVFGGCSRNGVDCSCLVQHVYRAVGVNLPRVAADQFNAVQRIAREELEVGDLVFFANTYMPGISHVGIYIGGGQMITAPSEGQRVSVMAVFDGYWGAHYAGAGRVRR